MHSLRWDGQAWLLGSTTSRGNEVCKGELRVMLDLGAWMLLRFADVPRHRFERASSYLALSRADIAQRWNVLRSTLYSTAGRSDTVPPDGGV